MAGEEEYYNVEFVESWIKALPGLDTVRPRIAGRMMDADDTYTYDTEPIPKDTRPKKYRTRSERSKSYNISKARFQLKVKADPKPLPKPESEPKPEETCASESEIDLHPKPENIEASFNFNKETSLEKNRGQCGRMYRELEIVNDEFDYGFPLEIIYMAPDLFSGKTFPYINECKDKEPLEDCLLQETGDYMYKENIVEKVKRDEKFRIEKEHYDKIEAGKAERYEAHNAQLTKMMDDWNIRLTQLEHEKWAELIAVEKSLLEIREINKKKQMETNEKRKQRYQLHATKMEETLILRANVIEYEFEQKVNVEQRDLGIAMYEQHVQFDKSEIDIHLKRVVGEIELKNKAKKENPEKEVEKEEEKEKEKEEDEMITVYLTEDGCWKTLDEIKNPERYTELNDFQEEVNPVGPSENVPEQEEICLDAYYRRRSDDPHTEIQKENAEFLPWMAKIVKAANKAEVTGEIQQVDPEVPEDECFEDCVDPEDK